MSRSFTARYRQIADILKREICQGVWKKNDRLPSRAQLCRQYQVSAITINSAWKLLTEAGMIEVVHGSGAYVRWTPDDEYAQILPGPRSLRVKERVVYSMLGATPLYTFMMKTLAESFMISNPDIRIVLTNLPANASYDPWLQKISEDDLPACGEFFWHSAYAKLDALLPLEELEGFETLKESLSPLAFFPTSDAENRPHIHSILFSIDLPMYVLVNRRIFEMAGISLPERIPNFSTLIRWGKALSRIRKKHPDIYPTAIPIPAGWHNVKPYLEYLGQNVFDSGFNPNSPEYFERMFQTEESTGSLETLGHLRDSGTLLEQVNETFALGRIGFLPFASSWTLQLLDFLNPNLEVKPYAMPFHGSRPWKSFISGFGVGIFRSSCFSENQKNAAWRWLQYLFKAQPQYVHSQMMNLPVKRDVKPYVQKLHPDFYSIAEQGLKHAVPQFDFVGMRNCYARVGRELAAFLKNKTSADLCIRNIRYALQSLK